MLTLLAAACVLQGQAPIVPVARPGLDGRGRDPWVFRCIFEDRTRMLILAPAPNWWMAFNPETGAMHKVWQGKLDFRGKVWDFSQDNSRAEGKIFLASPSEIFRFPDSGALPSQWKANNVSASKAGWLFSSADSTLTSPSIDAEGWQRVFLAFDETGRKGRFKFEISGRDPQWFHSATSPDSETGWQWNFKRIERPSKDMVIAISTQAANKSLRNLRLYGDRPSWLDSKGNALEVVWDGYQLIERTKSVIISYRLRFANGKTVSVQQIPDLTSTGWKEKWKFKGIPKNETLRLKLEGLSQVVVATVLPKEGNPFANGGWVVTTDGEYRLNFDIRGTNR